MEVQDLIVLVQLIEKVIPLIQELGKETKPLLESFSDAVVDLQVRAFNRYLDSGMSREEAMLLVLDSKFALGKISGNLNQWERRFNRRTGLESVKGENYE